MCRNVCMYIRIYMLTFVCVHFLMIIAYYCFNAYGLLFVQRYLQSQAK